MSNPISKPRGTFALTALLLAPALLAIAQSPTPQTQSTAPTLHVYSRETIIDVLVTDDKGQPVRGLTRSDFTVEEDNKPQPIRSFSEYDKTTPPPPPRTLPPDTYTNATPLPASGPVQVFLFDRVGSSPADLERSKQYIAKYLHTMPAGTTVALFSLSPIKGLRLLQGFTSDGTLAASAVENLDVEWITEPDPGDSDEIAAATQIATYVAGVRGRKNLIWTLTGPPPPILHDGGLSWGNTDINEVHRLMNLYDLFTREQIAIYLLRPQGVHDLVPRAGKMDTLQEARAFLAKAEIPLFEEAVADGTGGATSNSNDYQGTIAKIVDDTEHSYTLSYVPTRPDSDGHFHPIKIIVDRPGLHLNYRPGYNDEHSFPLDAILKAHLIQGPMRLGAIPATQILFDLHVEPDSASAPSTPTESAASSPATPHKKGTTPYTTLFTFDPTQLTLTEAPDGTRTANIELDLSAFDFYGQLVTARSQTFNITITPAQYAGFVRTPLNFSLTIDLPRGQLTLHAGLFDTVANKAGTLEIPLTIPKKGAP